MGQDSTGNRGASTGAGQNGARIGDRSENKPAPKMGGERFK